LLRRALERGQDAGRVLPRAAELRHHGPVAEAPGSSEELGRGGVAADEGTLHGDSGQTLHNDASGGGGVSGRRDAQRAECGVVRGAGVAGSPGGGALLTSLAAGRPQPAAKGSGGGVLAPPSIRRRRRRRGQSKAASARGGCSDVAPGYAFSLRQRPAQPVAPRQGTLKRRHVSQQGGGSVARSGVPRGNLDKAQIPFHAPHDEGPGEAIPQVRPRGNHPLEGLEPAAADIHHLSLPLLLLLEERKRRR